MLRWCLAAACFLPVLSAACSSDGEDEPPTAAPDAAPDAPDLDHLHAGYARVALPWRVGAKPGQVGTDSLPEHGELLGRAITEILPVLTASPLDPPAVARSMTSWVMGMLEERTSSVGPGRYNALFEAGRGIELTPDVKALVVRRGAEKIALVRADLYIMHEHLQRRVAELVEAETGIGRDQLFLVATHNHSVPHSLSPAAGVWILADAFDPRQWVYVSRRIADAVIAADRRLEPVELRHARQEFREVQHNIIGPGTVSAPNPDGEPETVPVGYPYDHIDPDFLMLRFDRPDGGRSVASLFVFGMHPESLPGGHGITSGEWPAHVEQRLEQRLGAPFLWMPGPLGDSEPDRGTQAPDRFYMREGFEAMQRMVRVIGGAAERAYEAAGGAPADPRPLVQQLARDIPGTEDFPLPTSEYLGPRLPMLRLIEDSAVYRLHLVRLGDVLLLGAPAEITTDVAFNIKSRVDREAGNVYQGYVYPEAPEWLAERIGRNFSTSELDPEQGVPVPMIVSHANGYMGYIVTRWEYENRSHYRQDMTALGPETADHVATALVDMARELAGGPPLDTELPDWHAVDLEGVTEVADYLRDLEPRVAEMSRALPASDPERVGTIVAAAPEQARAGEVVELSWVGGTNDLEPPAVWLERETDDGWEIAEEGPNAALFLLFEAPDRWTVRWGSAEAAEGPLRFRVEGAYRGPEPGVTDPDPIWDPAGANLRYEVTSPPFRVMP